MIASIAVKGHPLRTLGDVLVQVLSWLYLAAGLSLALWLLLERRGPRYVYGAWLAALTLVLASLARLFGPLGFVAGFLCAVLVALLVAAMDWATSEHAA
jgi:hypothetical protein